MAIEAQLYSETFRNPFGGSENFMENPCGFNELPYNFQQQQQYMQHQRLQNLLHFNNNLLIPKNSINKHPSMDFSIEAEFQKQMRDIGDYISVQNERLSLALVEQRKQQISSLLGKYESHIQILLTQKDGEIAKAVNRTIELENLMRRMEIEKQTWERVASENEAMVMSLNNTIEEMRESVSMLANGVEDAESCCDETGGNRGHEDRQKGQMMCKSCDSGISCCVFLPCRHLSSCKACEAFLDSCPVCRMPKKTSIQALM